MGEVIPQADRKLQRNSFSHLAEFDEGVSLKSTCHKKKSVKITGIFEKFHCNFVQFHHFHSFLS